MITVLNLIQIVALAATLHAPPSDSIWVERQTYVMGTVLQASVAAESREQGIAGLEAAFAEVRRLEGVLSSWRGDSEIGAINGAPAGRSVRVSPELLGILENASRWSERTQGAFDPAVGALVDAWDLRGEGRHPSDDELARALGSSGLSSFVIDGESGTVTRRGADAWVDTGGFGKGVALDAARAVLVQHDVTAAHLDFGGQILVFGEPAAPRWMWAIAVAHPAERHRPASGLRLAVGSVATSAQSERYVEAAGERLGHIIDPRSGRPVPAWGSVTVVAADATTADILSTALFVLGPQAGREIAEQFDDIGVLFLEDRAGQVVESWNSAFVRFRTKHP